MSTVVVSRSQARRGVTVHTNRLNHIDIHSALVTLRFGMFFDGTNNNAYNATLGEQCRASMLGVTAEQCRIVAEAAGGLLGGGSYAGGVTNVYKLFDLYRDDSQGSTQLEGEYAARVYVEGVGTTAGEPDSPIAQGTGISPGDTSGVDLRVNATFYEQIDDAIKLFVEQHPDAWVDAIEFDVFGFSRGAAGARHFINEVLRKEDGPLGWVLPRSTAKLKLDFDWKSDIRVGFVGLFETVAAMGIDASDNNQAGIKVYLPEGCARKVVQLRARDEHRLNFPLSSVSPPHQEVTLPGVHSDLGGGYNEIEREQHLMSRIFRSIEPIKRPLQSSRAWQQAQRALQALQAQDFIEPGKGRLWVEARPDTTPVQLGFWGGPKRTVLAAVLMEREVSNAYTLITLRAMHALASDADVPFKSIPDEPAFQLPEELRSVSDKLISYARGGGYSLTAQEERLLRYKYLHRSAHWIPTAAGLLFVSRPTDDAVRVVYPNAE